jgi:hypothetical protein
LTNRKTAVRREEEEYDDDSFFTEEGFSEYSIVDWNESIKLLTQTDKDILYLE